MSVTSTSEIVSGRIIKTGTNNPVISQSLATFEANIANALLSEKSSSTFITDYISLTGMDTLGFSSAGKYVATQFDQTSIEVATNLNLPNRNICVVGNYVSNTDTTEYSEATNTVKINASTTPTVTSNILDDSAAYKNASVRVTLYDPYFDGQTFGDSTNKYTCSFDDSQTNKKIYTRNVNANSAHTVDSSSITASEYTEWNTQDGYGSFFINGSVNIDGTTGEPVASLYTEGDSLNLLSKNFTIDLKTDNPNVVPIFGRYQITFASGSGTTVDVETTGNNNLVLTTDLTSWNDFILDLDNSVPLDNLPSSIYTEELTNWVLPESSVSSGFTLELSSSAFTTTLSLVNNGDYSGPFDFDFSSMNFTTKSMYILEKSMETNASNGSSTLTDPTINGTTYTNNLTITNGSLSLEETADANSGYIVLLDGEESLGINDYETNGSINVYDSSRVSVYNDSGSVFPRATRTSVSSSNTILDNFAVQYKDNEYGYQASVGLLGGDDLTALSVTYAVSTLVGQTTTLDGADNWNDVIDVSNNALAIVKDTNSSISKDDIIFYNNTNTYANNNDNNLSIIDIVCNKVWSESKVYDSDNNQIPNIAVDIQSTNMSSVNLNLSDIRVALTSKTISDLTLSSSDSDWSFTCPDSFLTTSVGKLGVIDDSMIIDLLLNGQDTDTSTLSITLKPHTHTVLAKKFTKFHNVIEIDYNTFKQITYDDEFTILNYSKSEITTSAEITNFSNVPVNTKLHTRSYTETFNVKIPFRFGNYENLYITSPTITQTVTYYVLTDNKNNDNDLPRYFLNGIKDDTDADIYATVNQSTWDSTITFSNKDFKTHSVILQQKTTGDWEDVSLLPALDSDLWYNTQSTISSSIGTYIISFTLSPDLITMNKQIFYVDMELAKGTTSFTISGKSFTQAQINTMSSVNLNSFNFSSFTGTSITGLGDVTYSNDTDADPNTQATTTLTAAGYTFKLTGELYLSIRIFVCPNGMFKSIKTGGANPGTTYHSIETIGGYDSLNLGTGVYAYNDLRSAIRNTSSATWSLNKDAISASYYDSSSFGYTRLTSLNQEFRPYAGWRGFKTTIVRGFVPDTSTIIYRTPSTYEFNYAGNTYSNDLYTGFSSTIQGSVDIATNGNVRSLYSTEFGSSQSWDVNLTYGNYTISDTVDAASDPIESTVPSFTSVISSRRGIKILSTSLNTNTFTYIVQYTSSNTLTVRRHPDIDAPDYTVDSSDYVYVTDYSPEDLRDNSLDNSVGNILKIHYIEAGTIPEISCQFSISPPFLKFTAIDPADVSTIPFDASSITPVTRYLSVINSVNNYYPFSSHPRINNISFVQNNLKQHLAYLSNYDTSIREMNVANYNMKVEVGSGLDSITEVTDWDIFYDDVIMNNGYSDDYITITAPDGDREFQISMNQHLHPAFSNFFVYDSSFAEYNLQLQVGSSFISGPSNGSNSFILEFIAGDCTKLDMYAIRSMDISGDNFLVTFIKYSSGDQGIANQFLNATSAYGFSVPYINVYTKTLSTALYSGLASTSPKRNLHDLLENLRAAITNSTFNSWTSQSLGGSPPELTLVPINNTGAEQLVNYFTLTQNIPRSIFLLQLQDSYRLEDLTFFPRNRVRYDGQNVSTSIALYPRTN